MWLLRQAIGHRPGACWAGTGDANGTRLRSRAVGDSAAPEFIPKRNPDPSIDGGRIVADAERLQIGAA